MIMKYFSIDLQLCFLQRLILTILDFRHGARYDFVQRDAPPTLLKQGIYETRFRSWRLDGFLKEPLFS